MPKRDFSLKKLFLVVLLFISTILSATHHHSDLKPHYDCPVCVFQINNNAEEPDLNPVKLFLPEEKPFEVPINYKNPSKVISFKANQRAPPISIL